MFTTPATGTRVVHLRRLGTVENATENAFDSSQVRVTVQFDNGDRETVGLYWLNDAADFGCPSADSGCHTWLRITHSSHGFTSPNETLGCQHCPATLTGAESAALHGYVPLGKGRPAYTVTAVNRHSTYDRILTVAGNHAEAHAAARAATAPRLRNGEVLPATDAAVWRPTADGPQCVELCART